MGTAGCCVLSLVCGLDLETQLSSSDDLNLATRPDHMNIFMSYWAELWKMVLGRTEDNCYCSAQCRGQMLEQ